MPRPDYMDSQPEVNSKMRAILVDWLVEIHLKYRMKRETLFLAVNIVDRYLGLAVVTRSKLQLIGVGGMKIAAKFEETHPPDTKDFVYMTDGAYSKEDVLETEVAMLIAIRFDLCIPTASHYLDRYQQATKYCEAHVFLLQYLVELALLDYRMLRYPPSYQVAAATFVSNMLLKINPSWPSMLVRHSAVAEEAIQDCASRLYNRFETAAESSVQAVRWKYSQPKFGAVATVRY
jgi:cyclin B